MGLRKSVSSYATGPRVDVSAGAVVTDSEDDSFRGNDVADSRITLVAERVIPYRMMDDHMVQSCYCTEVIL
jgi:hypothetical protein